MSSQNTALLACLSVFLLTSCTGLVAGPATTSAATVPVPRDSAWVRARRAYTAEVLTLDVNDSVGGHLTGLRYPSASAKVGSVATCRVQVMLNLAPGTDGTQLAWTTRWVAPAELAEKESGLCEQERQSVLARIEQTISPTP